MRIVFQYSRILNCVEYFNKGILSFRTELLNGSDIKIWNVVLNNIILSENESFMQIQILFRLIKHKYSSFKCTKKKWLNVIYSTDDRKAKPEF